MVSSKFSRRPVVQQPPPVCKSKLPPPIIVPPPPPPHDRLWLEATWAGVCSDFIFRSFSETIEFVEPFPDPGRNYNAIRLTPLPIFQASILWPGFEPSKLSFEWSTSSWRAIGYGDVNLPEVPPVDIGPEPLRESFPLGAIGTWRLYTS